MRLGAEMRITKEGMELIRQFEGCALISYKGRDGIWTLGWGRARGIGPETTCTQKQADAWLLEDLATFEELVLRCTPGVGLNDNQLSALVSLCYNVGFGRKDVKDGFQTLKSGGPSTLLTGLLAGDFAAAALEFPKWSKVGGIESAGVLRRRLAEQALFIKEVSDGKTKP